MSSRELLQCWTNEGRDPPSSLRSLHHLAGRQGLSRAPCLSLRYMSRLGDKKTTTRVSRISNFLSSETALSSSPVSINGNGGHWAVLHEGNERDDRPSSQVPTSSPTGRETTDGSPAGGLQRDEQRRRGRPLGTSSCPRLQVLGPKEDPAAAVRSASPSEVQDPRASKPVRWRCSIPGTVEQQSTSSSRVAPRAVSITQLATTGQQESTIPLCGETGAESTSRGSQESEPWGRTGHCRGKAKAAERSWEDKGAGFEGTNPGLRHVAPA